MDIRTLEAFVAVAEAGGFTRAAERLHLVQSSVSASVKSLERELGFRLFDRRTRTVILTAEGRSFLPYARAAIGGIAEAKDAAADLAGGVAGTVSVGVLVIPDMLGVAGAVAHLHAQHPGIRIDIRSALGGSAALQADVVAGELDLCFVVQPIRHPPELVVEPLGSGRHVLACGTGHAWAGRTAPVEPDELNGTGFVEFPAGFSVRETTDAEFVSRGIVRSTHVEVAHLDLIASYIAAGVGIGFVTEQVVTALSGAFGRTAARPSLRGSSTRHSSTRCSDGWVRRLGLTCRRFNAFGRGYRAVTGVRTRVGARWCPPAP